MASQGAHPACLFLLLTLLATAAATSILVTAILSNYWEIISFDRDTVEAIAAKHNTSHTLTWLWDGRVGKVDIKLHQPAMRLSNPNAGALVQHRQRRQALQTIFLVPMHGGIWTLCIDLEASQVESLEEMGWSWTTGCANYLSPHFTEGGTPEKNDWVQRMQNLSISCSLVCCILLGASAVVGSFGIIQRQISAVLITGVMYILASTFGLFCLSIMHFKRRTKKDCGVLDSQYGSTKPSGVICSSVTPEYSDARVFSHGWSLELGWGGVVACLGAALLWLALARIMRYNPISLS